MITSATAAATVTAAALLHPTTLALVFHYPFLLFPKRSTKRSTKVEPRMFVLTTLSAFFSEVLGLRDQGVARCFESGSFGSSVTRRGGIHFLPFPPPSLPLPLLYPSLSSSLVLAQGGGGEGRESQSRGGRCC